MAKESANSTKKSGKRPAIHRSNAPSQAPIVIAYLVFAIVMIVFSYTTILSDTAMKLIISLVTLCLLTFAAIYQIYFKLRHPLVMRILLPIFPIWFFGALYIILTSILFSAPVFSGHLTRGNRDVDIPLTGGAYYLFVTGKFPPPKTEGGEDSDKPVKKTKKPKLVIQKGKFVLTLGNEASGAIGKTFSGLLESGAQRRKLTKRDRSGVLRVEEMSRIFPFRLSSDRKYSLRLTNLDEKLADDIAFDVYPRNYWPYILAVLALASVLVLNFLDFLIKSAREYSFLAPAMAVCYGFALYLRLLSMPDAQVQVVVMAVVVGAAIGMAISVAAEYALTKTFREWNRKWRISL